MTNAELADWLERLDSHAVYDEAILGELDEHDAAVVPTQTVAEVARDMEARGLGGHLNEGITVRLFTGYVAAEALTRHRLGHLPDSVLRLQGRGSIHRACVAALREPELEPDHLIQRFPAA